MPLIEIEEDHLVTQVGDIVPAEMDDEDIRECMAMLCIEGADIREQLENPARAADENWAFRARDALRHRVRDFEACRAEAIRRGMPNLPDIDPRREAARLARVTHFEVCMAQLARAEERRLKAAANREANDRLSAENAVKRAKRAAEHEERMRLLAHFDNPFVLAAQTVLDRETYLSIWAKARETYPDHPHFKTQRCAA